MRAFNDFMNSGPGLWMWAVCLFAVAFPVTLLHELGHAVAARRLLRGRVMIDTGLTMHRWEFTAGGIEFRISPLTAPLGHAGTCVYEGLPTARETLAIALAGPAASFAGFVLSLLALPYANGFVRDIVWMAVMTQGFGVVLNLVPFSLSNSVASDGKTALDALRHLGPSRPEPVRVRTRNEAPPTTATSPPCAGCGHRRDEHVDLATGRRGACCGQDYDFQSLAPQACECQHYLHLFSVN